MKRIKTLTFLLMIILSVGVSAQNPRSVFTDRPVDEAAIYFTPENFKVKADGRMDVSEALQEALNRTKQKENGCGILFIPEGVYKLNKTIYIPSGVRIIGYGGKRPVFVLAKQAPGFQEVTRETAKGKYLFWFIGGGYRPGGRIGDANAGTFYSSMMNVDIRIEGGNPNASAIRAHFAQPTDRSPGWASFGIEGSHQNPAQCGRYCTGHIQRKGCGAPPFGAGYYQSV